MKFLGILSVLLFTVNFAFSADMTNYREFKTYSKIPLSSDPLNQALSDPNVSSFSFTSDLTEANTLNYIQSSTNSFTVNGNDYSLIANPLNNLVSGFIVAPTQTLNISNLADMKGFSATGGGVVFNVGGTFNISGTTFSQNGGIRASGDSFGGAIHNRTVLESYVSNSAFVGNYAFANNNNGSANGGAIHNDGDGALHIYNSYFNSNFAVAQGGNNSNARGGAVFGDVYSVININNSLFENNFAYTEADVSELAFGGAIFNKGNMSVKDTNFLNNNAHSLNQANSFGGAIYNLGDLTITADNSDVIFSGNTSNNISNDIYNDNSGEIIFNGNKNIILNGGIAGGTSGTRIYKEGSGSLILNSEVNTYSGDFALNEGTLKIGENGAFFDHLSQFSVSNGTTLDFSENKIQYQNLGQNLNHLGGIVNLKADVDLANSVMDRIGAGSLNNFQNGTINVSELNLLSDSTEQTITLPFADSVLKDIVTTSVKRIDNSPIYRYYDVNYDRSNGDFTFSRLEGYQGFKPSILSGAVATQLGGYFNLLNLYQSSFANMDMTMMKTQTQRTTEKYANRYAGTDGVTVYSPVMFAEAKKGLWLRPYSSFENVPLQNGPTVSNVGYGSLFGGDSELYEIGKGFEGMFNVFGAYNGSHQTYDGVGIYQNGGAMGATGIVYKGNFFSGLTVNVGVSAGEASSNSGQDNFTMLSTGIASKSGYNWGLADGKFVIQPSYMMSYSFVNTFDYNTANGANIQTKPLNAIQIVPGIKLVGNLKNSWQPYFGVNMIWNIMDQTDFKANNVQLTKLSVKPYVEYGLGVQKHQGERFTGFLQAMIRNGGRNGISLSFGLRWAVGK